MFKFKIMSLALFFSFLGFAQDVGQATKSIDAEQYEKAKTILKQVIAAKPSDGRANFLLGTIYLKQDQADSAKVYFDKGLAASDDSRLNLIGLGQMEFEKGNIQGARSYFSQALEKVRKKDTDELVYVARAYMAGPNPDYNSAIQTLNRAKAANPNDAQVLLALGDAYYGNKQQNEAYVSYRDAYSADNSLIRAKMQQGVLLKGARSFAEAVKNYESVIASNPNYGPVYRELAETYYLWGKYEPRNNEAYTEKALTFYEKYMSLTDYSLSSRMRRADFLILTKKYEALEEEAKKMKEIDNVNPRIMRYLGFAAYENGNTQTAITSLEQFISNPKSKVLPIDHMMLGLAKLKQSNVPGEAVNTELFNAGVADLQKAVQAEPELSVDLSELGKDFFDQKLYREAAAIYEVALVNEKANPTQHLQDMFYYGYALYYANNRTDVAPDMEAVKKAEAAFASVAEKSPATQDAYLFRARANSLLEDNQAMASSYEDYVRVVSEKGAEELAKETTKRKLLEAHNNIGAFYAATNDSVKAREHFNKALELNPGDQFASQSLQSLKK